MTACAVVNNRLRWSAFRSWFHGPVSVAGCLHMNVTVRQNINGRKVYITLTGLIAMKTAKIGISPKNATRLQNIPQK